MRLARILGAIGRALISAGVIVLLFVAYQLWGTGLQHAQAQSSLEDDFLELLESDVAAEAEVIQQQVEAAVSESPGEETADGGATDAPVAEGPDDASLVDVDLSDIEYSPQLLSQLYPEDGSSLARIVIADINVDEIVVEGVSVEDLRKGPGHYGSTPNPGQAGNAAIAGHRTTYGAPFHRIDELDPGAEIVVTTLQGTFVYRVTENVLPDGSIKGHFIVSPSDTWVLDQTGKNLITLTACHPKYSARQRIIVQAELVGEPAITIPRDSADGDLPPVELSAGEQDERAAGEDISQVISDEVALDDDPSQLGADDSGTTNGSDAVAADLDPDVAETETGTEEEAGDEDVAAAAGAVDDGGATGDSVSSDDVELTSAQTPFNTTDDFGEGLNGDRTKIRPAIMWGLAGFAIWVAAWFAGNRLNRKWTMYAVCITPFALVLWSAFVNVDQALPSY